MCSYHTIPSFSALFSISRHKAVVSRSPLSTSDLSIPRVSSQLFPSVWSSRWKTRQVYCRSSRSQWMCWQKPFHHDSVCTHFITIQSAPISSRLSLRPFHHDSVCAHFINTQSAPISSRLSLRPFNQHSVCAHFITTQSAPISSRLSLRPFHHDLSLIHISEPTRPP